MSYEHISEEDWEPMRSLAYEIAKLISDSIDSEMKMEERELRTTYESHLEFLERKYGPHPWLIDIRADACEKPEERVEIRISALELVDDSEADLKGQFYLDLARDCYEDLKDRKSAAIWLSKAKGISQSMTDSELISDLDELEKEMGAP